MEAFAILVFFIACVSIVAQILLKGGSMKRWPRPARAVRASSIFVEPDGETIWQEELRQGQQVRVVGLVKVSCVWARLDGPTNIAGTQQWVPLDALEFVEPRSNGSKSANGAEGESQMSWKNWPVLNWFFGQPKAPAQLEGPFIPRQFDPPVSPPAPLVVKAYNHLTVTIGDLNLWATPVRGEKSLKKFERGENIGVHTLETEPTEQGLTHVEVEGLGTGWLNMAYLAEPAPLVIKVPTE